VGVSVLIHESAFGRSRSCTVKRAINILKYVISPLWYT
jgi:hypothetical protein